MNNCGNSNNNSSTKVKSYKHSEVQEQIVTTKNRDSSKDQEDIISGYNPSNNYHIPRGTLVICQRNSASTDNFSRFKSRAGGESRNDFRMARGSGSVEQRGRGGARGRPFKKSSNDRDSNSESYHHPSRSKLFPLEKNESMKNHENSKYYEDKRLSDDTRISKLLRRLCREENYDHFMGTCRQLQEGILAAENKKYIRRFLEFFCDNILEALHSAPSSDAKQQVAKCLSRVGFVVIDNDFKKYVDWIFNKYSSERKEDVKYLLMKSFGDTLNMNTESSNLQDCAMMIMSELQSCLENVDRPDLLRATVDCMLVIIEAYPKTLTKHFRDTVDILVGWHIDSTQQKPIVTYASESLQKLRNFWIEDLDFTLTLLGQFVEDMEGYDEEMSMPPPSGRSSPGDDTADCSSPVNVHESASLNLTPQDARQCICKLTSLIGVFNTVAKSVAHHLDPNTNAAIQWSFLADCLSTMLKSVVRVLEIVHPNDQNNETIANHAQLLWQNNLKSSLNWSDSQTVKMDNLLQRLDKTNVKDENVTEIVNLLNKEEGKDASKEDVELMLEQLFNSLHLDESKRNNYYRIISLSEEKEELVIVANECAFLLLTYLKSRLTKSHDLLYKFIDLQLERIQVYWDNTIVSTLNFISKVIQEVSANLPLELVHKLLGEHSVLFQLRFRNSLRVQNATLEVYQSLLSLKNIPLLQETYRYVLAELEIAYRLVVEDVEDLVAVNPLKHLTYNQKHAEVVVSFLLRALSDIANASNSIIGMWALKPSIFELLAVKLKPYNNELAATSPLLQYNILYLLYAHCSRYSHFIQSSSLILNPNMVHSMDIFPGTLDVPSVSPTSGHLSIILDVIANILESISNDQAVLLALNWLQEISSQADQSLSVLIETEKYQRIIENLLSRGATTDRDISLSVCNNFQLLLSPKDADWTQDLYKQIIDLVILHVTSTDPKVRESYAKLIGKIPVNIVVPKLNQKYLISKSQKQLEIQSYSVESVTLGQRLYMKNNNGEMQSHHFKTYMHFILQDFNLDESRLGELFTLCWRPNLYKSYSSVNPSDLVKLNSKLMNFENENSIRMFNQGLANGSFLMFWAGLEAAQHCVQNKLRTALGKPQETFTTIEGALKNLAREISYGDYKEKGKKINLQNILNEHTRVRLLVEFLEHLEKVIHNAAEGCAVALQPLPKPVRTFFHTNRSTCREWLNRIRLALCVVSLHAGLSTNVLRNGQRLIEDLDKADNTHGVEFERAVLCTTQAMVRLGEAEALQGLYIYTKEKDRKFPWLKAAIEEAAGRYELAAESYKQILLDYFREDSLTESLLKNEAANSQVLTFCIAHISRCYEAVIDWKHLASWKNEEKTYLDQEKYSLLTKQIFQDINVQQAQSLHKLEQGENLSLVELSDWSLLDDKSKINWSSRRSLVECSNSLTNVALRMSNEETRNESLAEKKIIQCQQVVSKTLQEALRNVPSEYLTDAVLLQYASAGLTNYLAGKNQHSKQVFDIYHVDKMNGLGTRTLSKILWWSELFAKLNDDPNSAEVASLRLHVARSARKEGNYSLAKRQITRYFTQEQDLFTVRDNQSFDDIVQNILNHPISDKWSKNSMKAFKETSKLLCSMEKTEDAVRVCSVTALGVAQTIVGSTQADTDLRETGTKMLLMLCKWLQQQPQQETKIQDNAQLQQLLRFESQHNDGVIAKLFGKTTELIPHCDMVIGKLTQMGVQQCPDLPLAWASFAAWCYKCGRKIVDNSHSGQLTDTDKANIRSLLPKDVTESDLTAILSILEQNRNIVEDEGDIDVNDINTSEMIENQLRNIAVLRNASNQHLSLLVEIWRQAQKRIYSYYELSANAYFQYLQLAKKDVNDCITITATLRLLRLIVKHAMELQNVLETGLATTPTAPWKEIIPQLFSRLSHPEAYVRTRVSELLCRIADNSPYLITFPSVVGAVTPQNLNSYVKEESDNSSDTEAEEEEEANQNKQKNAKFLDICCSRLTDCLSNSIPDSVNQVKILVTELRRITLLWDELWLTTLCHHHSEFTKRFEQLELEIQKVQDNTWLSVEEKSNLIVEKHKILMKPIIVVLEDLMTATTSVVAETPHERLFQEKFGPYIEEVIGYLKNPKTPSKPQVAAQSLKQLELKLAQRVHKKGAHSLHMSDISPVLATMRNTCIAMPGVNPLNNVMVTIRCVDDNVQILPTKTKPKKLMFHGSDGNVYTYLFKGLEDLHLDERIMQFLSICNTMMSKSSNDTKQRVYRARHYSVIPLGPRSGLIQWVDGVTPLFALYKKWQQRDSAMTANKNNNVSSGAVLRPSELFYSKLTPLLKERDISVENRKEWPVSVLKQVLKELMTETPKDLLAKEIWCNSINSGTWWQATKNYSYSVAVMSIIGYIIGLGDRHLDNVLVDLNTGEVVHIDYNVCFEKGKTLRVPEKVPFRMTPNIVTALGVTGVEGIFRLACEHTLRVMRRGRETLLTLLEAFVYDPLVDWKADADCSIATYGACQSKARYSGIGRKRLELETTRAMFNVRMKEMRAEWLANRDELVESIPLLRHHLSQWMEATNLSQQCQNVVQERRQQLTLLKEAMTMGRNHTLYSVIKRYGTYKRAKEAREKAKQALRDKMEECQKHISMHNIALNAVKGTQLSQWLGELNAQSSNSQDEHHVFELVKEFLQNAGQSPMIVQCEQSETELTQLAVQESMLIRSCLDLLSQYSAICSLYPTSMVASQHRSVLYQSWVSQLLASNTVDTCNQVLVQLETSNVALHNQSQQQNILDFSYQMQLVLNVANERLKKTYERMVIERLPESIPSLEQAYNDAKANIESFVRREQGNSERAIECVAISLLCVINRKLLCLEGSSQCAVECLANLTTMEGVWYLDEMWLISSFIGELLSVIPQNSQAESNDNVIKHLFECLRSTEGIYKSLQELNYNFHTVILPEATKTIITEEPTVMRMIDELDEIILSAGMPLSVILSQLEIHLRCTIMEMDSPHEVIQRIVDNVRVKFEDLMATRTDTQDHLQEETLTPGQMLLMGFNGLFEKVQMETNSLISALNSIEIPPSWKKVDQIREAKETQTTSLSNETTRRILEDIFLVKRLLTMQDFFVTCRNLALAFKGDVTINANVYDDDNINKSIKVYTADFVRGQVFGLTTQTLAITLCFLLERMGFDIKMEVEQQEVGAESKVSIEDLCRRLFETSIQRENLGGFVFTQANSLMETLDATFRAKLKARLTQQAGEIARASVQRLQLQITAHLWLHEDTFVLMRNNCTPMNPLHLPTFMLELRKNTAALTTLQSRVIESREQQQNLVTSVAQRLKWASGANPALGEVMSAFDNAVVSSCEKLTRQNNLASVVISACSSILHYEALRTRTSESLNSDANLIKLVKHWQEICLLTNSMTVGVSPVEEKLVELVQTNNESMLNVVTVDANWLRQAEKIITDAIVVAQKVVQDNCLGLVEAQKAMKEELARLQNIMTEHHKLMTDVRTLLRVMAKQKQALPGLQDFLSNYRAITENISTSVKELQCEGLTTNQAFMFVADLDGAIDLLPPLYEQLLNFANPSHNNGVEKEEKLLSRKKKQLKQLEAEMNSPKKRKDQTTGKAVQERNAYALNVWRRVRIKLDGRDPNGQHKSTTAEQVDFVIREALNLDNLALLYEGWTPWV